MGSYQSANTDRSGERDHERLASNGEHAKSEKMKKTNQRGTSRKTSGDYEHLPNASDNSTRSSPCDTKSSNSSLRNGKSSSKCCSCFGSSYIVDGGDRDGNSPDVCVVPDERRRGDSVALLRASSRSSLRENGDGSSSRGSATKPECDEEIDVDITDEIFDRNRSNAAAADTGNLSYATEANRDRNIRNSPPLITLLAPEDRSSLSNNRDDSAAPSFGDLQETRFCADSKTVRGLSDSKKYLSFPFGLFGCSGFRPKPRSGSDSHEALPLKERNSDRTRHGKWKDLDCPSNNTSCADSGKASASEICPTASSDQGSKVRFTPKAPIAKMDSLETTSVDSLTSKEDDFTLDVFDLPSSLDVRDILEKPKPVSVSSNGLSELAARNQKFLSRNDFRRERPTAKPVSECSSHEETKLNKSKISLVVTDEELKIDEYRRRDLKVQKTLINRNSSHETRNDGMRKVKAMQRMSYPLSRGRFPLAASFDPTDGSNDLPYIYYGRNGLPSSDDEIVVLDRSTYDSILQEVESWRTMLLQLAAVICQDKEAVDQSTDGGETSDDFWKQKLTKENEELEKKATSLLLLVQDKELIIKELQVELVKKQQNNNCDKAVTCDGWMLTSQAIN